MDATDKLVAERGKTHGDYTDHARVTQGMVRNWSQEKNWDQLSDDQRETLHMVAHKIGRILTGDPNIADHWDDIAGYARLSGDRVRARVGAPKSVPVEDSNRHAEREVPAGWQWVEKIGKTLPIQQNLTEWEMRPRDERQCYQWSDDVQYWCLTAND